MNELPRELGKLATALFLAGAGIGASGSLMATVALADYGDFERLSSAMIFTLLLGVSLTYSFIKFSEVKEKWSNEAE